RRAVEKLVAFTAETGQPLRFTQSGALKIARTERDVDQLRREVARGKALGLPVDFVTPAEATSRMPVLEAKGILAITFNPTDCNVEPAQLPIGYCRAAEAAGVVTLPHTPVTGFRIEDGRIAGVSTARGEIRTETVVDAAGAWSRVIADLAGARLPVVP